MLYIIKSLYLLCQRCLCSLDVFNLSLSVLNVPSAVYSGTFGNSGKSGKKNKNKRKTGPFSNMTWILMFEFQPVHIL